MTRNTGQSELELKEGQVISIPFHDNEKFVVGLKRAGGMGCVYQLVPLSSVKHFLALKTYQGGEDLSQFEREAKAWIGLGKNPNISHAYSFGAFQRNYCIISTWYDRNLHDLDPRKLSVDEISCIVSGMITGLLYAHKRLGLIHKDIKPSNILLDKYNTPKIADFGLSIYLHDRMLTQGLTAGLAPTGPNRQISNRISGTPYFMAPELFNGVKNSVQTDIFAFGVTVYNWLLNTHPYVNSKGESDLTSGRDAVDRIRRRYGSQIEKIADLVANAIDINIQSRATTWELLIHRAGYTRIEPPKRSSASQATVSEIVATARVFREQGDFREASELLKCNITLRPQDPLLLNALGSLFLMQKKESKAIECFYKAMLSVKSTEGQYDEHPYIDPHLNFGNSLRDSGQLDAAAEIFREAKSYLVGVFEAHIFECWEFCWLDLFEGKFEAAAKGLLVYMSRKRATELTLALFCLSAFLTGEMTHFCGKCVDAISEEEYDDVFVCQYLSIIGSFVDPSRLHRLKTRILKAHITVELEKMSQAMVGGGTLFRIPMSDENVRSILRGIDANYVGGAYDGTI